mmetsp:Transcript_89487/g.289432  ORF Transcript_89487/g.289432 Transcript_89487/m.289432 type:complete len:257 (-) Transcript_89487:2022-2792(-)
MAHPRADVLLRDRVDALLVLRLRRQARSACPSARPADRCRGATTATDHGDIPALGHGRLPLLPGLLLFGAFLQEHELVQLVHGLQVHNPAVEAAHRGPTYVRGHAVAPRLGLMIACGSFRWKPGADLGHAVVAVLGGGLRQRAVVRAPLGLARLLRLLLPHRAHVLLEQGRGHRGGHARDAHPRHRREDAGAAAVGARDAPVPACGSQSLVDVDIFRWRFLLLRRLGQKASRQVGLAGFGHLVELGIAVRGRQAAR